MNVTVIGAAIVDVLANGVSGDVFQTGSSPVKDTTLSFGGDALNEAVALSRLGKEVELISKVGGDEAGRHVLEYLRSQGVGCGKVKVEPGLVTGINIVLVDEAGERYFLTNPKGSLRALAQEDVVPYLVGAADLVCFASIFVSPHFDIPAMEQLFARIKKGGSILAADMTKAKHGENIETLAGVLPYVDILFANEEELTLLTGKDDQKENAAYLNALGVCCAVIKRGAKGCMVRFEDTCLEIPAYPVAQCVDTTGAGDCFAAGFLYGYLEGYTMSDCGRLGCAAASCCVETVGATAGLRSLEQVLGRFFDMGGKKRDGRLDSPGKI